MKLFTIHDAKAETYSQPFYARTQGEAQRMFSEAVNGQNEQISKHYSDFTLFEVGRWDDSLGIVEPLPAPKSLGNGVDFKKPE